MANENNLAPPLAGAGAGSSSTKPKKQVICERCGKELPSKNALFRHLKNTIGTDNPCLRPDEIQEFMDMVVNREENFQKVAILYGYILSDSILQKGLKQKGQIISPSCNDEEETYYGVKDGDHAAQILHDAALEISLGKLDTSKATRINRSYGCNSRNQDIQEQLAQDQHTGALTEIICIRLPSLFFDEDNGTEEEKKEREAKAERRWVDSVNDLLQKKISDLSSAIGGDGGKIKVFGRLTVSKKFNAEVDVSHRRIDYLLPADLIYGPYVKNLGHSLQQFCDYLISFNRGQPSLQSNEHGLLTYLHNCKRKMQSLCTGFEAIDLDDKSNINDTNVEEKKMDEEEDGEVQAQKEEEEAPPQANKNVVKKMKRRRYHNFTPKMMAHEYLAYRRLDRVFHRATIRSREFEKNIPNMDIQSIDSKPFVVLSLKGDLFLNGQAPAILGLFIAITLGFIDDDIVDCIFDEDYTNLVPAPILPSFGQFAAEAWYTQWEGKMNYVLCPRDCDRYKGWNTPAVLKEVEQFQEEMYSSIIRTWACCDDSKSYDETKRLQTCSIWIKNYLEPWSAKAKAELHSYRKWKEAKRVVGQSQSKSLTIASALLPSLESTSADVPRLYTEVLHHLQEINNNNLWPSTSPKRQLVMVSTSDGKEGYESLIVSHMKAQSKSKAERDSAYSFREGEGGASGSFSVGVMPGKGHCEQPRGNTLFPELMKAAFELEIALCPDREPSSTIAINRNAQFRPHVDNGAGAGQSRSLIVGLGTYVGGELMVEGKKNDIRYKPLQFNGWTERHWTLPFRGERFSLVWFTPKGCDGVRGIDLCK